MKDSLEKQQKYYELGENYFWLATHYDIVMSFAKPLLKKKQRSQPELQILDLGAGPGNLVARLLPWGQVTATDASEDALDFCKQKHNVATAKVDSVPFPFADNSFDFIFAIEVIEHIENDHDAAKEIYRILKPGGFLITTVPAFMFLWGAHDEWNGHYRRYTKANICQLGRGAGFAVRKSRYFKILFFFPLFVMRKLKKASGKKENDFIEVNKFTNQFFRSLINAETPLVSAIRFPFGSSIISVFQKV